jgi:hypothetical protein
MDAEGSYERLARRARAKPVQDDLLAKLGAGGWPPEERVAAGEMAGMAGA